MWRSVFLLGKSKAAWRMPVIKQNAPPARSFNWAWSASLWVSEALAQREHNEAYIPTTGALPIKWLLGAVWATEPHPCRTRMSSEVQHKRAGGEHSTHERVYYPHLATTISQSWAYDAVKSTAYEAVKSPASPIRRENTKAGITAKTHMNP